MSDPRLDRLPEFDERSRNFQIRTLLSSEELEQPIRAYTWGIPSWLTLDQGREGACVGFSWSHELAARPKPVSGVSNDSALTIYRRAQQLDQWPGEGYSGTSVIAGAKAVQEQGLILGYSWAGAGTQRVLDDLKRGVAYKGPAVLGLNWYTGMFRPDSDGRIRPTGNLEGGHAIVMLRVRGEKFSDPRFRNTNWLYNSWGARNGWPWGWLTDDDLERLLEEDGEACIPFGRKAR